MSGRGQPKYQHRDRHARCAHAEFAFEKNLDNVRRAVQQMKIDYPIVIDNDYSIWRAFKNRSWPALYFVDARGRIRDHHFGEGEYERSERVIQRLLADAGVADAGEWRRVGDCQWRGSAGRLAKREVS